MQSFVDYGMPEGLVGLVRLSLLAATDVDLVVSDCCGGTVIVDADRQEDYLEIVAYYCSRCLTDCNPRIKES